jgi:hypothetical protein
MLSETYLISIDKGMFQTVFTPHYPFVVVSPSPYIPGDVVFKAYGV